SIGARATSQRVAGLRGLCSKTTRRPPGFSTRTSSRVVPSRTAGSMWWRTQTEVTTSNCASASGNGPGATAWSTGRAPASHRACAASTMPDEMSQPNSSSGAALRRSELRNVPVPHPKSRRRPAGDRFLSNQSTLCSKNVSALLPARRLSGSRIPPSYPAANASNSARGAGPGIAVTQVEALTDQKQRTILRLLVDPTDVLAHDPEADEGEAAEGDD